MDSTPASNTKLSKDFFAEFNESERDKIDNSQLMWDYRNRHRVQGIPVSEAAKELFVNSYLEVKNALLPIYNVKVWSGYLSPLEADQHFMQLYQLILQNSVDSNIIILNLTQHFRSDIGKLMVVISYAQTEMGLNPRYLYLAKES